MILSKKVVIVTGGGSGIGRALALEFARNSATVVISGRRQERLQETATMITEAGGSALPIQADITDPAQAEKMVSQVINAFGHIDILFNNAGSFNAIGSVWEIDPDAWWNDVTVNLRGTMLCCRYALPHMLKNQEGIIFNMSGGNTIPGGTGYSSSKAAVIRFTELLARELKQKNAPVQAFIMEPGFVYTEMTSLQIDTAEGQEWLPNSRIAIDEGRNRPPEDCARATMKAVAIACPALSGSTFGPHTDFEELQRKINEENSTAP